MVDDLTQDESTGGASSRVQSSPSKLVDGSFPSRYNYLSPPPWNDEDK